MKALRWIPVLLLALGLTGCGYVIETAAGMIVDNNTPQSDLRRDGPASASLSKVVANKVAPNTLVARDGSVCTVPEARFDYIEIGQTVICVWSSAGYRVPIGRHDDGAPGPTAPVRR